MQIFDYLDLKFNNLTEQINTYLRNVFNRSDETFSNASPFGQIINVEKEIYQQVILYQKNIVRNFIIDEANNQKAIRNLARIGGHNPSRAISATGTISLNLRPGVDIEEDIPGSKIKILDKTKIKNLSNGLIYSIRIINDSQIFEVGHNDKIKLNIIQGTYETYEFTGNGEINQSFSVNVGMTKNIDNFEVEVKYNNEPVTIKDGLFDMLRFERACYIRTGMNGGIDVYFGNGDFGFVPGNGSLITVEYLITNGTSGIILTPQFDDFQWVDDVFGVDGEIIEMENLFEFIVEKEIGFASNGETSEFTKSIMPYVSRNFVLSSPRQYIYTLKRLGLFSKVNAYNTLNERSFEGNNKVYLFLVPNIRNYFTSTINYFNVPIEAFYLDDNEKDKVITYLRRMANISVGTVLEIIQPVITKYVLNIYIRKYRGFADENIKQDIISNVSDYLSTLDRDDRIPKSDIINIIENIDGVDSVNATFVCKKNEDYHKIKPESKTIFGLDPVLGDIVVEPNELAIIRGGWSDRNFTYYNETLDGEGIGPINVMFVGITDENLNK